MAGTIIAFPLVLPVCSGLLPACHVFFYQFVGSFGSQVRALFWIAVTNFLFPGRFPILECQHYLKPNANPTVAFDIVEVILLCHATPSNTIDFTYITITSYFVTVIAVVFATREFMPALVIT